MRPPAARPALPPAVPATGRSNGWAGAVLGTGVALAVVLHLQADFRFPVPWIDEAHFLTPALNLARHLTLDAAQLNAPEGVYWMPDGYAAVLAAAFTLLPDTLAVGRWVSLALTLVFAGCLHAATASLGGSRLLAAAAIGTWLVSPRVVMMANLSRMEPLVLALAGVALLLAARRRWTAALAVAALSPLAHPMGLLVCAAFAAAVLLNRAHLRAVGLRPGTGERALLAVVALAWLAEAAHFLSHLELLGDDLRLQIERKQGRSLVPSIAEGATMGIGGAGAVSATRAASRLGPDRAAAASLTLLLAAAFAVLTSVGNMMWYRVLGVETALLLIVVASAVALPAWGPRPRRSAPGGLRGMAAVAAVVVAAAATTVLPVFGMRVTDGTRGEWARFADTASARLHEWDRGLDAPAVVAVVGNTAIGFPLAQERWRHLRFVTSTPVAPLAPEQVDYLLSPDGLRRDGRAVVGRLRPGEHVFDLVSEQATFQLHLYRRVP
ncbi:MAG: hypothetical protein M3276_07170 [Actinomycetota bacterium]|nr:hypothetical protein [Actinomycetota bacterium]